MHILAQPSRNSLQQAGSSRESARAGIPVRSEDPAAAVAALSRTERSSPTMALYLRKGANWATTRRCRMIAGAAAGTAILPLAALLAARGLPPEDPRDRHATDSVLGAACASPAGTLAAATHAETETSSGQRDLRPRAST
jgi:hypothetical protein